VSVTTPRRAAGASLSAAAAGAFKPAGAAMA